MNTAKEEYLGILCKFYLAILFFLLSLYMRDGYYMLGDGKYLLFRNGSFICLGIWLAVEAGSFLYNWIGKNRSGAPAVRTRHIDGKNTLGIVDIFMLAYAGCVLLSAAFSKFDAAWIGYEDWYMGAVSQLIFVGIYFFVSRYYGYNRLIIYVCEGALLAVVVIGLLSRLGVDVLGVFRGLEDTDWVRSNMLSTIGNINWFCGYLSVVLAFPITGYLYSKGKVKKVTLYTISVLGLVMLVIQGSDSGPVLAAVAIGCCLLAGIRKTDFFKRSLLLLTGVSVGVFLIGQGITFFDAWYATPMESWIYHKMDWIGWLVLGAAALLLYAFCRGLEKNGHKITLRKMIKILLCTMLLIVGTVALFVLVTWSRGNFESWGSGRGILWKLAWDGFLQADGTGKLIGAGPDCFVEYLNSIGKSTIITTEGHWAYSVFVNAHNEWLNHLVNLGILGVAAYAGIFVCAARRYRGMMICVLMLAMYAVHSLVSFQQVLNAPLFFAVLGICEATYRRKLILVSNLT